MLLITNFGTGVIVARSLGPLGRGEFAAIGLWPSFLATLATLGIPTALNYHTRRKPESGSQYYAASVLIMLAMGALAAVIGVAIIPLLFHGYVHSVVRTAQFFMIFAPQVLLGYIVTAHLEAVGSFRQSALIQIKINVLTLLTLLVLHFAGYVSPVSVALAYAIPNAMQILWIALRLWPGMPGSTAEVIANLRVLLDYGLRSYGADIVGTLASQLDLAVIVMFLNAAELGLYATALTLSRLLNIVQTSIVTVVFPRASSLESEARIALITRAARLSTLISMTLGALFLATIPALLPRLYGSAFIGALALMPLLVGEAVIGGLGSVLKQSLLASNRPFVVAVIEAGSVVCALSLLFLLVPRMNITGAATALLCTSVVRAAAIIAAYPLVLKRSIPRLLPDASDVAYVSVKLRRATEHRGALFGSEI